MKKSVVAAYQTLNTQQQCLATCFPFECVYTFFVLLWKCDFICVAHLMCKLCCQKKRTHLCNSKTNWSCQPNSISLYKNDMCLFVTEGTYTVFTVRNHWHNSWPYNTTNTVTLYGSYNTHILGYSFYFIGICIGGCFFFAWQSMCQWHVVCTVYCAVKMF